MRIFIFVIASAPNKIFVLGKYLNVRMDGADETRDKGRGIMKPLSLSLRHSLSHPGRGRDLGSYVKPGPESLTAPSCFVSPRETNQPLQ